MASRSDAPVALVTGVAGFTGGYVADALGARGYVVHGWGHHTGDAGRARLTCPAEAVDLLDRAAVTQALAQLRPQVVVHLAAISFVAHGDAEDIYRVNVVGTRNLLESLAALPDPPRVLLASSASVYGNAEGLVDESAPPSPQNDYAVSKLAMEYMAGLWRSRLPITVVRPFNYSGVGQSERFLLPKIVSHFKRRADTIELGNLDVWRDFNDVRAVADCYVRLMADAPAGGTYNVCSGTEYSLREVVGLMESISGHRICIEVNPAFVRQNEVVRLRGSDARLESVIGLVPRIPLADTLRWMYEN